MKDCDLTDKQWFGRWSEKQRDKHMKDEALEQETVFGKRYNKWNSLEPGDPRKLHALRDLVARDCVPQTNLGWLRLDCILAQDPARLI